MMDGTDSVGMPNCRPLFCLAMNYEAKDKSVAKPRDPLRRYSTPFNI
jgi:hypothetical protein